MNIINLIAQWFRSLFRSTTVEGRRDNQGNLELLPVVFASINVVKKAPRNDEIIAGELYAVAPSDRPKWTLFLCPCGCGSVVTLSLQQVHQPHWKLIRTHAGRPELFPSVWRDKGCLSHFWIKDGRVNWCSDTGMHPSLGQLR